MTGKAMVIRSRIVMWIERAIFSSRRKILRTTDAVLRSSRRISGRRRGRGIPMSKFALCRSWGRIIGITAGFLCASRVVVTASSDRCCVCRGRNRSSRRRDRCCDSRVTSNR